MTGFATATGTESFRQHFSAAEPGHFRLLQDVWVSSVGLGTYLGEPDDETDRRYAEAVAAALQNGCNLFDTAINYRCQRSERTIGRALKSLAAQNAVFRESVVVCTKGGYIPFDGQVPSDAARYVIEEVVNAGLASYDDLVGGCHCISPTYLTACLKQSSKNLCIETIDVYYLHNPEQQLDEIPRALFLERMEEAFRVLEEAATRGQIRYYGTATWNGFRRNPQAKDYLSLEELAAIALRLAGKDHHFRIIQLPYNLAMPEAMSFKNQFVEGRPMTILEAAEALGISVMASASILQGRLAHLPKSMEDHIPGFASSAQRAIQFVRSTPGVCAALVGMKQKMHVEENLSVLKTPALSPDKISGLFSRSVRS